MFHFILWVWYEIKVIYFIIKCLLALKGEEMKFYLVFLSVIISTSVLAAEIPLNVPSDPKAIFFVLEKGSRGTERTIVTKRVGPSGTSYSERLYNCTDHTVKYLGTGDSIAEMVASSTVTTNMGPIIQGSIAYYVGIEACKE